MEKIAISKSAFIKGLQCHKQIYLHYHFPKFKDPVTQQELTKFKRGIDIGKLAQQLFAKGKDASSGRNYEKWFSNTRQLIDAEHASIFEAAFTNGEAMTIIDVLEKNETCWNAWEVKSVLNVSDTHVFDLAFQCYVIQKCGIDISLAGIVHLNRNYKRKGELNVAALFTFTDLTLQVKAKQDEIKKAHNEMLKILSKKEIPEITVNKHCFEPYACSFMRYCWNNTNKKEILHELSLGQNENEILEQKKILFNRQKPFNVSTVDERFPLLIVARSAIPFIDDLAPFEKIPFASIDVSGKIIMHLNLSQNQQWKNMESNCYTAIHSINGIETKYPNEILAEKIKSFEMQLNAMLNLLAIETNIIIKETYIADIENIVSIAASEFSRKG